MPDIQATMREISPEEQYDENAKMLLVQKDEPSGYDVEMRGIFYAAREISFQLGREFKSQKYNDISTVYSIWILMNTSSDRMAKIHLTKEDVVGQSWWKEKYDVLNVVIIRLKKSLSKEEGSELHRLLGALFIPEVPLQEREDIIQKEFGIEIKGNRKEMLHDMCNLGQGILEFGLEQGLERGLVQGREKEIFDSVQQGDYSVERGAQKLCLSVQEFEKKMEAAGYRMPDPL